MGASLCHAPLSSFLSIMLLFSEPIYLPFSQKNNYGDVDCRPHEFCGLGRYKGKKIEFLIFYKFNYF